MDGQTNRPKPIWSFIFFDVGGITMHYCKSYVPQFMTILSFELQVRPLPSTYLNKGFEWHFSFSKTTVQNNFEIHVHVYMYKLWPGQTQFMPILTFI